MNPGLSDLVLHMRAHERTERETRLWELANEQVGLLRDAELRAEGLHRSTIQRRVTNRRLTRLHPGVYALGHTALQDRAFWLAALWGFGDAYSRSHWTAGLFHGWPLEPPDARVHLTVRGRGTGSDRVVVHEMRHLVQRDVHTIGEFRVTTIPRTFVDLADVMDWPRFRALADAQRRLDIRAIAEAQRRAPRRPGAALVTRLIEADDAHTKSEFERRFLRFLKAHDFPGPDALNEDIAGHKVDCVFRAQRVAVELDGRSYHQRRAQMRADRERDVDLQLAGQFVLRLVWDDLHPHECPRTAERVGRVLASVRP